MRQTQLLLNGKLKSLADCVLAIMVISEHEGSCDHDSMALVLVDNLLVFHGTICSLVHRCEVSLIEGLKSDEHRPASRLRHQTGERVVPR